MESSYQEPWPCTLDERSARGYCPEDAEQHMAELCSLYTHGPTIPEECLAFNKDYYGDAYYGSDEGWYGDDSFTDECIDSGYFDYSTGQCVTDTLPNTGLDAGLLLLLAVALTAIGKVLTRA